MIFSAPKNGVKDLKPRIIISRTDKIGDLVLSLPSFYMARKMYPESTIAVLVRNYNAGIVKNLPFIDETWVIDGTDFKSLRQRLKEFKPHVFAALYSDFSVLKAALFSGAYFRTGPLSKPLSWLVYNRGIIQKRSKSIKNEAEYNLDIIKTLNPTLFNELYEIGGKIICSDNNIKNAEKYLAQEGIIEPFILIHPFMGGSAKNFTDEEYAALTAKLSGFAPKVPIVLTSSKSDFHRLKDIKNSLDKNTVHIYENGSDILDLAALIDKSEVYVGGSTGPSHIAGNLRKKAVLIYPAKASQSPVRWGLFGNKHAEYIIPDKDNPFEDYSKKTFSCITDDVITYTAQAIINKLYEKI